MRTLLIEPTRAGGASLADDLDAAGHQVVRCHPADGPSFPCAGLSHEGCPLDDAEPIDVAIAVRDKADATPTADEAAVTCAIRTGLPVVVVAEPGPNPFEEWSEACHDPAELADACDRAISSVAERRAAPLRAEVQRLLEVEQVDAGGFDVEVRRDGTAATVLVRTGQPLPIEVANTIATRIHAVDQRSSWPTSKLSVSVGLLG